MEIPLRETADVSVADPIPGVETNHVSEGLVVTDAGARYWLCRSALAPSDHSLRRLLYLGDTASETLTTTPFGRPHVAPDNTAWFTALDDSDVRVVYTVRDGETPERAATPTTDGGRSGEFVDGDLVGASVFLGSVQQWSNCWVNSTAISAHPETYRASPQRTFLP